MQKSILLNAYTMAIRLPEGASKEKITNTTPNSILSWEEAGSYMRKEMALDSVPWYFFRLVSEIREDESLCERIYPINMNKGVSAKARFNEAVNIHKLDNRDMILTQINFNSKQPAYIVPLTFS